MRHNPLEHCWDEMCGPGRGWAESCNCNCPDCRGADARPSSNYGDVELNRVMTKAADMGKDPFEAAKTFKQLVHDYLVGIRIRAELETLGINVDGLAKDPELSVLHTELKDLGVKDPFGVAKKIQTLDGVSEQQQCRVGKEERKEEAEDLGAATPIEFQTRSSFVDERHLAQTLVASLSRDRLLNIIKAIENEAHDTDFTKAIHDWVAYEYRDR